MEDRNENFKTLHRKSVHNLDSSDIASSAPIKNTKTTTGNTLQISKMDPTNSLLEKLNYLNTTVSTGQSKKSHQNKSQKLNDRQVQMSEQDSFMKKFSTRSQLNIDTAQSAYDMIELVNKQQPKPQSTSIFNKKSSTPLNSSVKMDNKIGVKLSSSYQTTVPLTPTKGKNQEQNKNEHENSPNNDLATNACSKSNHIEEKHNLLNEKCTKCDGLGTSCDNDNCKNAHNNNNTLQPPHKKTSSQHKLSISSNINSTTTSTPAHINKNKLNSNTSNYKKERKFSEKLLFKFNYFVFSPDDNSMFFWLIILNICVLYNIWLIIARQSFEKLQTGFSIYWRVADHISDIIYLLDVVVQFRTGYLEQGLLVYNSRKLAINYLKSKNFLFDIFSLMPFELFQYYLGYELPILRFPRFFKCYRTIELYYMTESRSLYPNVWRVANLTHILFLLGHWFAGFYFLISKAEGFKGHWSYPEPVEEFALLSRMYLRSLYWSTLTLTTIGDLPPPETNWQWLKEMSNFRYLFSIAVHYLAVFVIALIVGQVGNVITNRNANRVEFERLLDGAKQYMRNHNVPADMQKRVQRWYDYSWSRGRMNGSGDIHSIGLLPDKLKTELALHVNLETLRKVTIFQECQPEFLHDLVLKMRAYIFTPGDVICRKGEIAREMFIIADGVLEVIGEEGSVLTKMYSGDFFGEIGILNIEGASNKRTADVRSVGYAELFSLSKEDVLSAVKDYPDAEKILIEYGRRRLNQNMSKSSINSSKNSILKCAFPNGTTQQHNLLNLNSNYFCKSCGLANFFESNDHHQLANEMGNGHMGTSNNLRYLENNFESDIELGLINEEMQRGLSTDMLGFPSTKSDIILNAINTPDINKITQKEEQLQSYLNESEDFYLNGVFECLESIEKNFDSNSVKKDEEIVIKNSISKLKEDLQYMRNRNLSFWIEMMNQKNSKIKILESRIRTLQKYVTQKKSDSVV